ncbi:MAG TPA: hypothetical protein VF918_13235 [Anaerolineales bacterium]
MNDKAKEPRKDLKSLHRITYLLRLWRTDEPGNFNWRASLEVPESGKRVGFANLEQLFAYLMDLIETSANKKWE